MKVWDLPTRLFHWLIVIVFCASWYTAEQGMMEWHYRSGVLGLTLLTFRIVWGFIGGSTARFATFVRSPAAVLCYLAGKGDQPRRAGHNPLGGYSVLLLLLVLVAQIASGLFAVDVDGLESGPLSFLVSFDQGRDAAEIHEWAFTALQVLVAIHVLAIAAYRLRGVDLMGPMIGGTVSGRAGLVGELVPAGVARTLAATGIAGVVAWWIGAGAPGL